MRAAMETGSAAEQLKLLLESLISALDVSIQRQRTTFSVSAPVRANSLTSERLDELGEVGENATNGLNGLLKQVREAEAALGTSAQAAAAAGALDPAALQQLTTLLGALGVKSSIRPTPTVSKFLDETYIPERRLREDAHRHIAAYVSLFAKISGDRPLADYKRSDIVRWVRTLEKIKATYGKSKGDIAKPIDRVLKESTGKVMLGATTIEKHITHLKAFFLAGNRHHRWASGDEVEDLFSRIPLSSTVRKAEPRKSWTVQQLNDLFSSPIWTGTRSRRPDVTKRHEPGNRIHRDAYWWLPIIALWTGARLEEIAQLQNDDLAYDVTGIPYLRIRSDGDRKLKTDHSRRNVPVHRFLVDLGFLDLFVVGKAGRVWAELKLHGRPASYGALYSSHFTDYRKNCGLYERLRDFHSLRRTVVSMLRTRCGVDALTVAALVGHDDSDPELRRVRQTDDYTDYSIAALYDAVSKLDYGAWGLTLHYLNGKPNKDQNTVINISEKHVVTDGNGVVELSTPELDALTAWLERNGKRLPCKISRAEFDRALGHPEPELTEPKTKIDPPYEPSNKP
ncbi:site-specific integrase [Acidisoma cladoniae]|uniref:site-specific integrase n=1 Tax=Acidisoma cladoniae TaxID=3040935 RepID=UPI00254C6209|nr:site-specific integrase [Acidisoma sp. PAMC 29798]